MMRARVIPEVKAPQEAVAQADDQQRPAVAELIAGRDAYRRARSHDTTIDLDQCLRPLARSDLEHVAKAVRDQLVTLARNRRVLVANLDDQQIREWHRLQGGS